MEGTNSEDNPSVIRVVDTKLKKEILLKKFEELGTNIEPEMIDFDNDTCYYGDHNGNVYKLSFWTNGVNNGKII